jgi:hypothetical protein
VNQDLNQFHLKVSSLFDLINRRKQQFVFSVYIINSIDLFHYLFDIHNLHDDC